MLSILGDIIYNLVFGLIVGLIARFLMPGRDPMGLLSTALLGISGAFVGAMVSKYLLQRGGATSWLLSIVGALILLGLYRAVSSRSSS